VTHSGQFIEELRLPEAVNSMGLCDSKVPHGASSLDPFEGNSVLYTIDDESSRRRDEELRRKAQQPTREAPHPQQRAFMTVEQAMASLDEEPEDGAYGAVAQVSAGKQEKANLCIGDIVELFEGRSQGTVRYVGKPAFAPGVEYVGLELTQPTGMNNGTVRGKKYFTCELNHGIFVKPHTVTKIADAPPAPAPEPEQPRSPKMRQQPSSQSNAARKPQMTVEQARRELEEEERQAALSPSSGHQQGSVSPQHMSPQQPISPAKSDHQHLMDENEQLRRELEELKKKHGGG